jgi:hypothetical protein
MVPWRPRPARRRRRSGPGRLGLAAPRQRAGRRRVGGGLGVGQLAVVMAPVFKRFESRARSLAALRWRTRAVVRRWRRRSSERARRRQNRLRGRLVGDRVLQGCRGASATFRSSSAGVDLDQGLAGLDVLVVVHEDLGHVARDPGEDGADVALDLGVVGLLVGQGVNASVPDPEGAACDDRAANARTIPRR